MADGARIAERLHAGDLSAAAAAMNLLESSAAEDRTQADTLLRALAPQSLGAEPAGHIIGVTGPPGAGKSTLLGAFVRHLLAHGEGSVAVIAVDPSSRRSGGALLGDRLRIALDRPDRRLFIRSSATGRRQGGLAAGTRSAAEALAVAFSCVIIETVGVGQAETEIAEVADTVALVVQPGSGDVLQFLKSGIMEIPDLIVVTKADMGAVARTSARDLRSALGTVAGSSKMTAAEVPAVVLISSLDPPSGFDELHERIEQRWQRLNADGQARLLAHRQAARRAGALTDFTIEYGERALRALGGARNAQRLLAEQDGAIGMPEMRALLCAAVGAQ